MESDWPQWYRSLRCKKIHKKRARQNTDVATFRIRVRNLTVLHALQLLLQQWYKKLGKAWSPRFSGSELGWCSSPQDPSVFWLHFAQGLCGKVLTVGVYRGGPCEKRPGCPMLNIADCSQLQCTQQWPKLNLSAKLDIREKDSVRNKPANIKGREGGGVSGAQAKAEIPLQPLEETTVKQVFPWNLGRDQGGPVKYILKEPQIIKNLHCHRFIMRDWSM